MSRNKPFHLWSLFTGSTETVQSKVSRTQDGESWAPTALTSGQKDSNLKRGTFPPLSSPPGAELGGPAPPSQQETSQTKETPTVPLISSENWGQRANNRPQIREKIMLRPPAPDSGCRGSNGQAHQRSLLSGTAWLLPPQPPSASHGQGLRLIQAREGNTLHQHKSAFPGKPLDQAVTRQEHPTLSCLR